MTVAWSRTHAPLACAKSVVACEVDPLAQLVSEMVVPDTPLTWHCSMGAFVSSAPTWSMTSQSLVEMPAAEATTKDPTPAAIDPLRVVVGPYCPDRSRMATPLAVTLKIWMP